MSISIMATTTNATATFTYFLKNTQTSSEQSGVAFKNTRLLEQGYELSSKPSAEGRAFEKVGKPDKCTPKALTSQYDAFSCKAQLVVSAFVPDSHHIQALTTLTLLGQEAPLNIESCTISFQSVTTHNLGNPLGSMKPFQILRQTKSL